VQGTNIIPGLSSGSLAFETFADQITQGSLLLVARGAQITWYEERDDGSWTSRRTLDLGDLGPVRSMASAAGGSLLVVAGSDTPRMRLYRLTPRPGK